MYTCIYACMHTCIHACIYLYTYMHTYDAGSDARFCTGARMLSYAHGCSMFSLLRHSTLCCSLLPRRLTQWFSQCSNTL